MAQLRVRSGWHVPCMLVSPDEPAPAHEHSRGRSQGRSSHADGRTSCRAELLGSPSCLHVEAVVKGRAVQQRLAQLQLPRVLRHQHTTLRGLQRVQPSCGVVHVTGSAGSIVPLASCCRQRVGAVAPLRQWKAPSATPPAGAIAASRAARLCDPCPPSPPRRSSAGPASVPAPRAAPPAPRPGCPDSCTCVGCLGGGGVATNGTRAGVCPGSGFADWVAKTNAQLCPPNGMYACLVQPIGQEQAPAAQAVPARRALTLAGRRACRGAAACARSGRA